MRGDKKTQTVSIKLKLLGIILPVVLIIVVLLVGISYLNTKNILTEYSQNLLGSSIENQANEIEAWLNENLSAFQAAKRTIEQTNPNQAQAFLVSTEDGSVLAHRDTSLIFTKLSDSDDSFMQTVSEKLTAQDYDMTEINHNLTAFEEISGTDWILLAILIERVVYLVIRPVKELTRVITAMTEGDFTIQVQSRSRDEIGIMSRYVQKFSASMRNMIASIHSVSDKLNAQANVSDSVSGQMYDASRLQGEFMKELNNTVEQLSFSVNEIAENATKLAMVVADTRDDGMQVDEKMNETVEISKKGKTDMQHVKEAMLEIDGSIQKLEQAIDKVGKASEEITKITGVIGNIADQTNLLSLNASIEAARAGEAGKGFAVVATEIGQLANTSAGAVHDIENLINEINTLVKDTVKQANESVNSISHSSSLVENALITFDRIFEKNQLRI